MAIVDVCDHMPNDDWLTDTEIHFSGYRTLAPKDDSLVGIQ